ncbi:hypothetical protein J6590_056129 [Homalodisca vitripennis]|nr:hypothetical protein J6590_056129 [Homalodisca vitripennis]
MAYGFPTSTPSPPRALLATLSAVILVDNLDSSEKHKDVVKHGIQLNADKCTVLHIAPPYHNMHVKLGDQALEVSGALKTLGVILDSELSFSYHIPYVTQRALGKLRDVAKIRRLTQSLMLSVAARIIASETVCRLQTWYLLHRVLSLQEQRYLVERLLYSGEVADRRNRQDDTFTSLE